MCPAKDPWPVRCRRSVSRVGMRGLGCIVRSSRFRLPNCRFESIGQGGPPSAPPPRAPDLFCATGQFPSWPTPYPPKGPRPRLSQVSPEKCRVSPENMLRQTLTQNRISHRKCSVRSMCHNKNTCSANSNIEDLVRQTTTNRHVNCR